MRSLVDTLNEKFYDNIQVDNFDLALLKTKIDFKNLGENGQHETCYMHEFKSTVTMSFRSPQLEFDEIYKFKKPALYILPDIYYNDPKKRLIVFKDLAEPLSRILLMWSVDYSEKDGTIKPYYVAGDDVKKLTPQRIAKEWSEQNIDNIFAESATIPGDEFTEFNASDNFMQVYTKIRNLNIK